MSDTEPTFNGTFQNDRYLARSWALLKSGGKWYKTVGLMALANIVPVAGVLGTSGYQLEWARNVAWGADTAPKQHDVRFGTCIAAGWRAFLAAILWWLAAGIVGGIVCNLPFLTDFFAACWNIFALFFGVFVCVAQLRATIYQKAGAGYRAGTLWEMVKRDPQGLIRILGIKVIGIAINAFVAMIAMWMVLFAIMPALRYFSQIYDYLYYADASYVAMLIIEFAGYLLSQGGPTALVALVIADVVSVLFGLLSTCALGLWMRQFNVPAWGRDGDPLPESIPPVNQLPEQAAPVAPTAAPVWTPAPVAPAAPATSCEPVEKTALDAETPTVDEPAQQVEVASEAPTAPVAPTVDGEKLEVLDEAPKETTAE